MRLVPCCVLLLAGACNGTIGDAPIDDPITHGPDGRPLVPMGPEEEAPILAAPAPALLRLTTVEWENTVRLLLHLDGPTGYSERFATDAYSELFDNLADDLLVGEQLWGDYQSAAEGLAARVVNDEALFGAVVGETRERDAFLPLFLGRAFRRPVTAEELRAFEELFDGASADFGGDAFVSGVEQTIRAALQSPYFIYRIEVGEPGEGNVYRLTDHELASRLSYALWDLPPDETLRQLADEGRLRDADTWAAQVERVMEDERSVAAFDSFYEQVLVPSAFESLAFDQGRFPAFEDGLGQDAATETRMFSRYIARDSEGSVADLVSSPETFVNARLARFYGIDGEFGDEFVQAKHQDERRGGLLTQLGMLARDSAGSLPSPIHRGAFLAGHLLCVTLGLPDSGITDLPEYDPASSNRERVEDHTSCGPTCHDTIINPIGFAFEHFDAIGQWRDDENGHPIDASATLVVQQEEYAFEDHDGFRESIVHSDFLHRCHSSQWLSYLTGRSEEIEDRGLLGGLKVASRDDGASIRSLITEILTSPAFTQRLLLTTDIEEEVNP